MKDVRIGKFGKRHQGQAQASKRGRAGRRAGRMSGDNSSDSKKVDERNSQ